MEVKTLVFALMTFFHELFTVVWIGGLIVTVLSYAPALKDALGPGQPFQKVMAAFLKHQSKWVYISMAGLILTGLLMSKRNPEFEQLFGFGNAFSIALSVKHILVILLIGTTLYRSLVVNNPKEMMTPKKGQLSFLLLKVNVVLAVAVLFSSGMVNALASTVSGSG